MRRFGLLAVFASDIARMHKGSAKKLPYVPAIPFSRIGGISPDQNHVAMIKEILLFFTNTPLCL